MCIRLLLVGIIEEHVWQDLQMLMGQKEFVRIEVCGEKLWERRFSSSIIRKLWCYECTYYNYFCSTNFIKTIKYSFEIFTM